MSITRKIFTYLTEISLILVIVVSPVERRKVIVATITQEVGRNVIIVSKEK